MLPVFNNSNENEIYGTYSLCSGGDSQRLEILTLIQNNEFYHTRIFMDGGYWYFYFDTEGSFQIEGDTLILEHKRIAKHFGQKDDKTNEIVIYETNSYIIDNNWKNRRKDKRTHFKNMNKSRRHELKYHDFDTMKNTYFKEEHFWNNKLIISQYDKGIKLGSLSSNSEENKLFKESYCKKF
jgi:hypothetical protein